MSLTFDDALQAGSARLEEALELFDSLEPVPLEFMFGTWRGAEFPTGHPFDGLLAATGWYGKHFGDAETVHPLLFYTRDRTRVFAVNPGMLPMNSLKPRSLELIKHRNLHGLVLASRPLLRTRKPKARLRLTGFRGKVSATMIYDSLPIQDVFRRVDDQTVLGLMDARGVPQPYFFVLRRDSSVTLI